MQTDKDKLFFCDMIIFSYELYNYVAARRYWYSDYPEPILVTDGTQFSEEVGKAVLVAWHHHRTTLRNIIKEDYPRYTGTRENLEQYIINRSKDLMNLCTFENISEKERKIENFSEKERKIENLSEKERKIENISEKERKIENISEKERKIENISEKEKKIKDFHFTLELLLVTAFTTEIYFFCYDFGLDDDFLPYFVDLWCKLFSILFFERFRSEYGWTKLREECMKISKIYDLEKIERYVYEKKSIIIKGQYFANDEVAAKLIADRHHAKPVTKFYQVNEKTESMVIDKDVELASKFSTLYKIFEKIDDPKAEVNAVYSAPKILVFVRLKPKLESFLMPEENKPCTTKITKKNGRKGKNEENEKMKKRKK